MTTASRVEVAAGALRVLGGAHLFRLAPLWRGLLILNYHRLGDALASPFDRDLFSATAEAFDAQLAFLRRHADVIGPCDLPDVLHRSRGRYVLLTFDDGYRDNYELALPLLRAHGITATFFLCTGFLDQRGPAWWDEIAWMIRQSQRQVLPAGEWFTEPVPLAGAHRGHAIRFAINRYKELSGDRTAAYLDFLADATGSGRLTPSVTEALWMTWDMVRELRAAGMGIGGHTVNHPILARLPAAAQLAEIVGCRDRIAAELGETPRLFAYPVGKPGTYDLHTRVALQATGFRYAFSFSGGYQPFAPFDPYDIRRCHVGQRTTLPVFQAMLLLPQVFARW